MFTERFMLYFQGGDNKFSIFVHPRPGFLLNEATTKSSFFLNRQVNDSIQVSILSLFETDFFFFVIHHVSLLSYMIDGLKIDILWIICVIFYIHIK